jgi:hypothetical protein
MAADPADKDATTDLPPAPPGEAGEHHWLLRHKQFHSTRIVTDSTRAMAVIAPEGGLLARASRQKRALLRERFAPADTGPPPPAPYWTPLGPSVVGHGQAGGNPPVSGRITGLAVGPGGQRVYAGSANGGVWYSEDAGASWTTLEAYNQPLSVAATLKLEADSLSVGTLAVRFGASAANDLIFVGTGEANFNADSYFGVGIKSSPSGGPTITWSLEATNLAGRAISRIIIDPDNPDVVFAATTGGLFLRPQGGAPVTTWNPVSGLPPGAVTDLVVRGTHGSRLYYAALQGHAVYQSADASTSPTGGSWVPVPGIPAGAPNTGRIALAVADSPPGATTPPVIYALLDNGTLFRLDKPSAGPAPPGSPPPDPATLFRPVSGIPRALFFGGQGTYDIVIGVDPSDPNTVYLAGDTVYSDDWSLSFYKGTIISTAAGYTFPFNPANDMIVNPDGSKDSTHVANDPTWIGQSVHADGHVLAFPQNADGTHDPSAVWVGTDGGLFCSTQSGKRGTFQPRNTGLAVTQMTFIAHRPDTDAVLFGGAQDQGNLRFRGEMVCYEAPEGDGGGIALDPNNPDRVMHQYTNMDLYTATDGGNSGNWTDLGDAGLFPPVGSSPSAAQQAAIKTEKGNTPFYGPIMAIARDATTTIAAFGSNRLWITTDWGTTWVTLPSGANPYASGAANLSQDVLADVAGISAIAWATASVVFVATPTLVWQFTLAGASWTPNPPAPLPVTGLPAGRTITALAVEDPARGTIYAVLGGGGYSHVWYFDPDPAINKWVDAGLAAATLDCPVHAVVVDPAHTDHVYIGTDVGVFQSVKTGAAWNWASFSNRLPECAVTCLSIHPRTRTLRAATHGLGVWEIALEAPTVDPDIYLRVNYADSGRLIGAARPPWLDGAPDPTNPGSSLTHAMSADIKTLRSSGSTLPSSTDFEGFASLKGFATDLGTIDSIGTNQVFVEVHNRGFTPIPGDQVRVLLLLADAIGASLPSLTADFATHIQNGDSDPSWLGASGWSFVDPTNPFRTLPGTLTARTPQVVEFDLKLPSGSSSDVTVAAFITTPADPLSATIIDVNALTMQDKHVALHTLHVGTDWRVVLGIILVVVAVAAVVIVAKEA